MNNTNLNNIIEENKYLFKKIYKSLKGGNLKIFVSYSYKQIKSYNHLNFKEYEYDINKFEGKTLYSSMILKTKLSFENKPIYKISSLVFINNNILKISKDDVSNDMGMSFYNNKNLVCLNIDSMIRSL